MMQKSKVLLIYVSLLATIIVILSYVWYTLYGFSWITVESDDTEQPDQGSMPVEDNPLDDSITSLRNQIDQKYCGGPCRFLLPFFIGEQESKAQMHVRQLAFLSGIINRTFVLPNMDGSRLGACHKNSFFTYYSEEWVKNNRQYFSAITVPEFTLWLKERKAIGAPATSQNMYIFLRRHQVRLKPHCFEHMMNMSSLTPQKLYLDEDLQLLMHSDYRYGMAIIEFLTGKFSGLLADFEEFQNRSSIDSEAYIESLEVLSLSYDRRSAFIQDPISRIPIPFSPKIQEAVDTISNSITPYWAIHWRMETINSPKRLVQCSHSLVNLVTELAAKANLTQLPTIFLLTDFPHVFTEEVLEQGIQTGRDGRSLSLSPASDTFHSSLLRTPHYQAIQHVYKNLQVKVIAMEHDNSTNTPANWTVIPVSDEATTGDKGMLGVIDKMLAIKSQVFIAGSQGYCARQSSYTARIVQERIERRKQEGHIREVDIYWNQWDMHDPTKMKNIVDYFG